MGVHHLLLITNFVTMEIFLVHGRQVRNMCVRSNVSAPDSQVEICEILVLHLSLATRRVIKLVEFYMVLSSLDYYIKLV